MKSKSNSRAEVVGQIPVREQNQPLTISQISDQTAKSPNLVQDIKAVKQEKTEGQTTPESAEAAKPQSAKARALPIIAIFMSIAVAAVLIFLTFKLYQDSGG